MCNRRLICFALKGLGFFKFNALPFLEKVTSFLKKMTFNWYYCLAFEIGLNSIF